MSRRMSILTIAALLATTISSAATAAPGGTMARIKATGRITFGYRPDARPFSYVGPSGTPAGYSIALCQIVADQASRELGIPMLTVEWKPVTPEHRFDALQRGDVDVLCGADTVTLSRQTDTAFSLPIFQGGIGALLRSDAPARLREVLSGRGQPFHPIWRAAAVQTLQSRGFSVVSGTSAEPWLRGRMKELDVTASVSPVMSYAAGVQRVLEQQSDVLFGDRAILLDAATRDPRSTELVVLDRLFTAEPIALAMAGGDDAFRLLVDRVLAKLNRTGDIVDIYARYFGKPDENALTFFRWNALSE